jgi:hypothetical protein
LNQNALGVLRGGGQLRIAQPSLSGRRTHPPEALSDSDEFIAELIEMGIRLSACRDRNFPLNQIK